jgi:hypothetical protein
MSPSYQTSQEAAVAQLLDSLPIHYRYRWVLRNQFTGDFIFDFFIQGGLFLECSASKHASSKAVNWLYRKGVLINNRFRVLKIRLTPLPFGVFLYEAPNADPARIRHALQIMHKYGEIHSIDKIFISLSELEAFLTKDWCLRDEVKQL